MEYSKNSNAVQAGQTNKMQKQAKFVELYKMVKHY